MDEIVECESYFESKSPTGPSYRSWFIRCTECENWKETAHMQLRTSRGYRSISYNSCHFHGRVGRSLCQCMMFWHQCPIHRTDPPQHRSTKSKRSILGSNGTAEISLSCKRPAPDIRERASACKRRPLVEGRALHQHGSSASSGMVRLNAETNPILAARFPHLVG